MRVEIRIAESRPKWQEILQLTALGMTARVLGVFQPWPSRFRTRTAIGVPYPPGNNDSQQARPTAARGHTGPPPTGNRCSISFTRKTARTISILRVEITAATVAQRRVASAIMSPISKSLQPETSCPNSRATPSAITPQAAPTTKGLHSCMAGGRIGYSARTPTPPVWARI